MKRLYCRCNGGDYFLGETCPFDGWSSPELRELARAIKRLERAGEEPSYDKLRELGVSEAALKRSVIIEFGSEEAVFEAISPRLLSIEGHSVAVENLDPAHL